MSIATFEGASAVFTFADSPVMLGLIIFAVVAVTLYALAVTMIHERRSYEAPMPHLEHPGSKQEVASHHADHQAIR